MEIGHSLLLLSAVTHIGSSVWQWQEKRNDKTQERLADLAAQVEKLEKEFAALQAGAETAPTHADLGKVYEAIKAQGEATNHTISALAATVHQLVGENRGQSDTLRLILNQITQKGMQ